MANIDASPLFDVGQAPAPFQNSSDAAPASPATKSQEIDKQGASDAESETPSCRICRGEETPEEALFHPCKCNGSIRFVHQECLMEWLSRSQKRHCELCKTPFRFTKLYDPRMPTSVPLPVFLKQAFIQVGRGILRILRYNLVAFVWLCWVPWTMRTMWRFLFWLGDGAWIDHRDPGLVEGVATTLMPSNASTSTMLQAGLSSVLNSESSIAAAGNSSGLPSTFESWFAAAHNYILPWTFHEGEAGLLRSNRTTPFLIRVGRRLLSDSLTLAGAARGTNTSVNSTAAHTVIRRQGTMLSDIKYLQTFSRWPALNRTLIDILEGQLITLFVMVLIILVFLIREWVVQQQPNLGIARAGAPDLAIEGPAPEPVEAVNHPAGDADAGRDINQPQAEIEFIDDDETQSDDDDGGPSAEAIARTETTIGAGQLQHFGFEAAQNLAGTGDDVEPRHAEQTLPEQLFDMEMSSDNSQRPPMPRHALDKASELHRVLEEERTKVSGDKWPGVQTFMDYWNRGDCQPQKVLDLIHEEGRDDELAWIVSAMKRLEDMDFRSSSDFSRVFGAADDGLAEAGGSHLLEEGSGSGESWQVLDNSTNRPSARPIPIPEPEELPSTVPTWLESQNLAWPPAAAGSDQNEHFSEQLPGGLNSTEQPARGSDIPSIEAEPHITPQPLAMRDAIEVDAEVAGPQLQGPQPLHEEEVDQGTAQVDAAPTIEQAAEAGPRLSFWDTLANLLWGHVELPAAERQQVADQLEPILQPEAEHEPPPPPPPPAQQAVQGQPHGDRPARAPAGPDPNLAAGLLPPRDPEVVRAAREAGLDPEDIAAIEEGEDLDGLVELIGLQGPLIALIQHGMVCGAIVTLVVFFGIWVPYIVGKVVLVLMSNPLTLLVKLPLRWTSSLINILIDVGIFLGGNLFYWVDTLIRNTVAPVGWILPIFARMQQNTLIPDTAIALATRSIERLAKKFTVEDGFSDSDIPYFSVIAHESLVHMETSAYNATTISYQWLITTLETRWSIVGALQGCVGTALQLPRLALKTTQWEMKLLGNAVSACLSLARTNPFKLRLEIAERTEPYNLELIHWSTRDRVFAILIGYFAFYAIGAMYVEMRRATRSTAAVRDEALEILTQAGGVLKVILIISIEMIAFPLYCGLLLDIAMLPLFQDRSLLTRLAFSAGNPLTSMFLHWFVGTCYMFHFALFVSMCRKAMRPGVLYFIRDPDDPTFHPVRDVLERNLVGQLRKILFSALVYGALVIVCLGAVVWGVGALPVNVLPIKWSSYTPSTELPIDLIVLNFLIPVAVKVLDPSQGLETMYKWWFRRCARALRLSHFLFYERREDEEGRWVDAEQSGETIRVSGEEQNGSNDSYFTDKTGQDRAFLRDGQFVRAPASDQVRIPRGRQTFLRVDANDNRFDDNGKRLEEPFESDLYSRETGHFQLIWLPPHFPVRIGMFIFLLWSFAAVTGLGVTLGPLCFGRYVFEHYLPQNVPLNDVHAFCFGAYVLGGPVFLAIKHKEKLARAYHKTCAWITANFASHDFANIARKLLSATLRALRVLYFYTFFGIVLPTLLSTVFEFYVFIPLNTPGSPELALAKRFAKISFIQNWTVGVLYLRIIGRVIHNNQESRPARALFALVAPANNGAGWLDPDIRLATRAFFLPSVALVGAALTTPLIFGYITNSLYFRAAGDEIHTMVYRYSYPALAASVCCAFILRSLIQAYRNWRSRIRDEVYLVGERLHNFGERRPVVTSRIASSG